MTIVVINYNGEHYLGECLRSIQDADGPILDVIVVDDGSTDSSVVFIKRNFPWVKVMALPRNQGPSFARNIGIHVSKTELVVLLDNDIVVAKGWLEPMVETALKREDAFICCSRILFYELPDIIGEDGLEAHFLGMPTRRNSGKRVSQKTDSLPEEVGSTAGISVIVRKSTLKKTGDFDTDFYYNLEDLDFCLKGRVMGYKCLAVPQSVVYHKYITGGTDVLSDNESGYSGRRAFYLFRNRWYIIIKFYSLRTIMVLAPALIVFEAVTLVFSIRKRIFGTYFNAFRAFLKNPAHLLRKRSLVQKSRVLPDRDLLSAFPLSLGKGTVKGAFEEKVVAALDSFFEKYWHMTKSLI